MNPPISSNHHPTQIPYEDTFDIRKIDSLKFLVQVILSASMLILCMGNLPNAKPENQVLYWSGITGILAWWMPSPGGSKNTLNSDKKDRP
jgi:hypothetical protein